MPLSSLLSNLNRNLLKWSLRKLSEKLSDFFLDLPTSFKIGGFLDNAEISNIQFNCKTVSLALWEAGIPYRLKTGSVDKISVNLIFTRGTTHVRVKQLFLVLEPDAQAPPPEDLIPKRLQDLHSRLQEYFRLLRKHFESKGGEDDDRDGRQIAFKEILGFLLKYDPSFSITFEDIVLRIEDSDRVYMAPTLHIVRVDLSPSERMRIKWPSEESNSLGVEAVGNEANAQFVSSVKVVDLSLNLETVTNDVKTTREFNLIDPVSFEINLGAEGEPTKGESFFLQMDIPSLRIHVLPQLFSCVSRISAFVAEWQRTKRGRVRRPMCRPTKRSHMASWWRYAGLQQVRSLRKTALGRTPLSLELHDRLTGKRYIRTVRDWLLKDFKTWMECKETAIAFADENGSSEGLGELMSLTDGLSGGLTLMETLAFGQRDPKLELGRYYVCSYDQLKASTDPGVSLVLHELYRQPVEVLALWHYLALEEARHTAMLIQAGKQNSLHCYLDPEKEFLVAAKVVAESMRQGRVPSEHATRKEKLKLYKYWRRQREKLWLHATSLELLMSAVGIDAVTFRAAGIPVRDLFDFLDAWSRMSGESTLRTVEFLKESPVCKDPLAPRNEAVAAPWVTRARAKPGPTKETAPCWQRLIAANCRYPEWLVQLQDGVLLPLPGFLFTTTLGVVLSSVVIVLETADAHPVAEVIIKDFGAEFAMHEKLTAAVVLQSLTASYLTPQGGNPVLAMQEVRPSESTDDLLFTSRVSSCKSNSEVKENEISKFIPGCWSWLELTFITSSELSRLSSELSLKLPVFLTLRGVLQSVEVQSHPEPLDAIRQCLQSYVTTFGAVAMAFRTSACTVPDVWPPRNPLEVKLADPKPPSSGALVTVFPGLAALTRLVLDGADVFSGCSTNLWSTYHSRYRQTFYRHLHQIYSRKRHGYPGILMTEEFWAHRLNPTQIPSPTLAAAKVPEFSKQSWTLPAKKSRNLDEVISRCNALSQRLANLIQRSQVRVHVKLPRVNVVLLNPLAAFEQSSPQMELRVSEEIVEANLGRWKQTDQLYIRVGNCRVATKGGAAQAVLSLSMIKGLLEQRRREWASVLLLLRSSCLEAVSCDMSQDPYFLAQRAHYLSSVPVEDGADYDTCETTLRPPSTSAAQKRSTRRTLRRVGADASK